MNVLLACEESQVETEAFINAGCNAMSCDLQPGRKGLPHYRGDIRDVIFDPKWNLIIFHPPCDFTANSGNKWFYHPDDKHKLPSWRRPHPLYPNRHEDRRKAVQFFKLGRNIKIKCPIVIEQPIPNNFLTEQVGFYHQLIQPWQFGHKETKATCLWLYGVPALKYTNVVGPPPKDKEQRKSWEKVFREGQGPERKKNRSKAYEGIAQAMATQWTEYLTL